MTRKSDFFFSVRFYISLEEEEKGEVGGVY